MSPSECPANPAPTAAAEPGPATARGLVVPQLTREDQVEFAALLQRAPVILFIHQNSRFRYVNPATETVLGYTGDQLLEMTFWQVIREDYREAIRLRAEMREKGEPVPPRSEFPIVRPDGEVRWLDCSATRVVFQGKPAVLGFALDITAAKAAERALRESETRFRQLAENIREVLWITDPDKNRILYVSPGYEIIWGRTCDSLVLSPRDWMDAIHQEDRPRVTQAALEKQAAGAYDETYRIVRPDGSIRWIKDRAFPVQNDAGEIYRIVGIAEDVTQQKDAEAQSGMLALLAQDLAVASTPAEAARKILGAAQVLIGWDACYLHLYETPDTLLPVLTMDLVNGERVVIPPTSFTLDPSPMMRRVTESGAQLINRAEPVAPESDLVAFGDTGRRSASMLYVPIRKQGAAVGVLSIQSYTPMAYDAADLHLLQGLADQCGGALTRIKAAEELRASEEKNRALIEAIPDIIIRVRWDGTIVHVSAPPETGPAALNFRAKSVDGFLPARLVEVWQEQAQAALESRSVQTFEFELPARHGGHHMEARVVPCGADEVLAILRDVTARRRLEKEILEISAREQRRIGHNLHDGLGQFLAGLALKAKVLQQNLAQDGSPHEAAAKELVHLAKSSVSQARALARGLDPVEAELTGLVPALHQLAGDTTQLFSVACRCQTLHPSLTVSPFAGLQLYRIAQEAITNAIVHGAARQILIELRRHEGNVSLLIANDGSPFNRPATDHAGMGLRIMDYRARCIGGRLDISSATGLTVVECTVSSSACGAQEEVAAAAGITFA